MLSARSLAELQQHFEGLRPSELHCCACCSGNKHKPLQCICILMPVSHLALSILNTRKRQSISTRHTVNPGQIFCWNCFLESSICWDYFRTSLLVEKRRNHAPWLSVSCSGKAQKMTPNRLLLSLNTLLGICKPSHAVTSIRPYLFPCLPVPKAGDMSTHWGFQSQLYRPVITSPGNGDIQLDFCFSSF